MSANPVQVETPASSPAHRGRKIAIALAATTLIGTAIVLASIVWSVHQSDIFKMSMQRVNRDSAVAAALGTPIKAGWYVREHMEIDGDAGTAEFLVPLQGSRAAGEMHFTATKRMGEWKFQQMTVETGGRTIEVVKPTS